MAVHLQDAHLTTIKSLEPMLMSPVTLQVLAQVFKSAPSPDIVTYTNFIKYLGHLHCITEALELFTFMKEIHNPDTISCTVLIRILCDSNMFDHALSVFLKMPKYNCRPDIICYNILIDKFGEAGEVNQVQKFCSIMEAEGIQADVVTYSSLVKAHCATNKIEEALLVLRFMEISEMVQPNTYTYNTIIKTYLDRKLVREAHGVFGRMEIIGCKPDLCSYNLFIKYYSDIGQGLEAYMYLKSMIRRGIDANESSYRICLYGLIRQCRLDEVLEVIQEMKLNRVVLCVCTYNNLIMWLGKMSRVDEAYSIFSEMKNPDEITINIVIQLLYKNGRGKQAWETYCLMKERRIKASVVTYNILIHGLCMEGNFLKAFELADRMESEIGISPDVVTYNCLLNSLCNRQQVEDACKLVLKMLVKGCQPDLISVNTLLNGMIIVGRPKDASKLFKHLREDIAAHSVPLRKLIEEMLARNDDSGL
ncbi:Pentatricopeptide repeat-containing protein [Thalictrum thalictroides]|uniref:Pentatricopeptide repeat-containing protein n=1 Tax=Thalictrum thalictroides TaxID=46969 RepID=A0A7J6VES9_THATH|nr:Pentatricopeptide repeat-containing protein [Thalictrum thalictroides]